MYYANYDNDGNIVGFYNPDIHKTIPSPSIPLTETQWQMCIDNPEEYKVDIGTLTLVAVEISLETLKTVKANEINAACQADIEGGFACGDYRYDSAQIDQSNLQLAVIGAISGTQTVIPYRCYLSDGSKDVVNHTPEQMIAVVQALGILLSTSIVKANNLKKSIAAATTQIELDAIVW